MSEAHTLKTLADPKVRELYEHREKTYIYKDIKWWDYTLELTTSHKRGTYISENSKDMFRPKMELDLNFEEKRRRLNS